MEILMLNSVPIETGLGRYVYNLYISLKNENIRIINFPSYNDYNNKTKTFVGDVVKPNYKNPIINILLRNMKNRRILKYIYNYNGIVHYTSNTIPAYKSKATKIGTIHDFYAFEYKDLEKRGFINSFYIETNLKHILNLDNVIVTTNLYKTKLLETYKYNGNAFVVPYTISDNFTVIKDKIALRKELNLPTDRILILSISDSSPHKNLNILPGVMKFLGDKFSLVRVGDKVAESITFPFADYTLINKIYNACDILVFPSLEEGFGFPMIEAFATGLPVVASDIPVFHEVGGDVPVFIDNMSPESIANGIKIAYENRESLSIKGLERAKIYSLTALKDNMMKVYSKILK